MRIFHEQKRRQRMYLNHVKGLSNTSIFDQLLPGCSTFLLSEKLAFPHNMDELPISRYTSARDTMIKSGMISKHEIIWRRRINVFIFIWVFLFLSAIFQKSPYYKNIHNILFHLNRLLINRRPLLVVFVVVVVKVVFSWFFSDKGDEVHDESLIISLH